MTDPGKGALQGPAPPAQATHMRGEQPNDSSMQPAIGRIPPVVRDSSKPSWPAATPRSPPRRPGSGKNKNTQARSGIGRSEKVRSSAPVLNRPRTILPCAGVTARNCSTYFVADHVRAMRADRERAVCRRLFIFATPGVARDTFRATSCQPVVSPRMRLVTHSHADLVRS